MEQHIMESMRDDLLKEATELYGISEKHLKILDGFENFVYEYKKQGVMYILRFVHNDHKTFNQVLAEIEFINYLAMNNACVSTVVHSKNDLLVEKVMINDKDYFSVSAFVKGKGHHVQASDKDSKYWEYFGEQVGKFHVLTKEYRPKHRREGWLEDSLYNRVDTILKDDQPMQDAMKRIVEKVLAYPKTRNNYGLIHTDMHDGNMVIDESGNLTIFDFDDSSYKHFISDIAIIIFYQIAFQNLSLGKKNEYSIQILKPFLKGYNLHNFLPREEFHHLQDFFKLREITLYVALKAGGDEICKSDWAKSYFKTYREKIINDEPFIDVDYVLGQVLYA